MENLEVLKKLGLTDYEARTYLSLARLGPSCVKEIVLDSKLPRNKVYEVLQKLEEKNKVVSLPVFPKEFKISNPEILKDEIKELNESVDSLIKIIAQPKSLEFKDVAWILKGKKAIEEKLYYTNMNAKREILSCNNLSNILYKNIRSMREAIDRSVSVKMICTFDKEKVKSYIEWINTGAKLRVFNAKKFGYILPRITIIDGEIARLTFGKPEIPKEENYLTVWMESRSFSQMLKRYFTEIWKNSEPIEKFIH